MPAKTDPTNEKNYKALKGVGRRVRFEREHDIDGSVRVVGYIMRFDPVTGERVGDEMYYPNVVELTNRRAALAAEVAAIDEELALVKGLENVTE